MISPKGAAVNAEPPAACGRETSSVSPSGNLIRLAFGDPTFAFGFGVSPACFRHWRRLDSTFPSQGKAYETV